jgi:hypothetical protein
VQYCVHRLWRDKTLGKVPFKGQELLYEVMGKSHNSEVAVIVVVVVAGVMVLGLRVVTQVEHADSMASAAAPGQKLVSNCFARNSASTLAHRGRRENARH